MHEGEIVDAARARGWPGVAEDVMVQRDILLAEYTERRVHIAHMSTGALGRARARGEGARRSA